MEIFKRTKIIATLGPGCHDANVIAKMLEAGMNCARFNFSHGNHKEHFNRLSLLQEAEKKTGIDSVYLLDTKGPEVRTGIVEGEPIEIQTGKTILLSSKQNTSTEKCIALSYSRIHNEVKKGMNIKIADGTIHLKIKDIQENQIIADVIDGGLLGSRKNVSIPEAHLQLPSISPRDIEDIKFAIDHKFDYIAASFIKSADDIQEIREILLEHGSDIYIIAKIENQEGIDNLKSIIQVSDGIMIARGDLAEQVPVETIPLIQKDIISQCNTLRKIVITATQMLQSMEISNSPTRAELTDVANAIFDGTDAIMLSGETAKGKYPIEAIKVMNNVALAVEKSDLFSTHIRKKITGSQIEGVYTGDSSSETFVSAAQVVAEKSNATMFACPTSSGNTPRIIACTRPKQPIIAPTISSRIYKKLNLLWGVRPILISESTANNTSEDVIKQLRHQKLIKKNEKVVIIGGFPMNEPYQLNTVQLHFEGKIILRARFGLGPVVHGKIINVQTSQQLIQHKNENSNKNEKYIYIIKKLDFQIITVLSEIAGIVVELPTEFPMETLKKYAPNTAILIQTNKLVFTDIPNKKEIIVSGKELYAYEP